MQKINFKNSVLLLMLVLILFTFSLDQNKTVAQTNTKDLTGYAWSSNIGWISFNCSNANECNSSDYKVTLDENKNLNGYAWSSNVGWLQFGNLSGFPSGDGTSTTNARIVGNEIVGWARFLAGEDENDGWDGWVSFDGSNYGVDVNITESDDATVSGYAWGDDVVGWIYFNLSSDSSDSVVTIDDFNQKLDLYCEVNPTIGMSTTESETNFVFKARASGGTGIYEFDWEVGGENSWISEQPGNNNEFTRSFTGLAQDSYNQNKPYVKVSVNDGNNSINDITCSFTINNSVTPGTANFEDDFTLSPKIVPSFNSSCNASWKAVNVSSCSILKGDGTEHNKYPANNSNISSESNVQLQPNIDYQLKCTNITEGAEPIISDPERCFVNPGFSE